MNNDDINVKLYLIKEFDEYGYFDEAIKLLDDIIFEKENEEIALINKAKLLIMHEKYSEASIIIDNLINENEDDVILSHAYELKGEMSESYEDSLTNFKKSLEYNCNNINTFSNIGRLYLDEGLIDEAIDIYNEMLDVDPNNMEALMILYCLTNIE